MPTLIDVLGVLFISCLLIIFTLLAVPYLYLQALRAAVWYGVPGMVLFGVGMLLIMVSLIAICKKLKS